MTDHKHWADDFGGITIPEQRPVAVYRDSHGRIVIRQEGPCRGCNSLVSLSHECDGSSRSTICSKLFEPARDGLLNGVVARGHDVGALTAPHMAHPAPRVGRAAQAELVQRAKTQLALQ
jgi:hypothetical protein